MLTIEPFLIRDRLRDCGDFYSYCEKDEILSGFGGPLDERIVALRVKGGVQKCQKIAFSGCEENSQQSLRSGCIAYRIRRMTV